MRRKVGVGVAVLLVVLAVLWWRTRDRAGGGATVAKPTAGEHTSAPPSTTVGVVPRTKPDPRTLAKGSIAGTVRDDQQRPIAGATVCLHLSSAELPPDFWEKPACTTADARGAFAWTELLVADYSLVASARGFLYEWHHPKGDRDRRTVELHAGEHLTGVDIVLHPGGVEITGVVNDISGGPIAHARVAAARGRWGEQGDAPYVETDDKGAFALWVPRGTVRVTATAEGYAASSETGRAPGTFELLLTPESSLSGTVVDARTDRPLEGVDVALERTQWDGTFDGRRRRTDERGAFRLDGLSPGRYTAVVHGKHGYGRSEGSTLVGLGQHVTGIVVRVYPTTRVIGKVVVAATGEVCTERGGIQLHDEDADRWLSGEAESDGTIVVEGVLPGTYKVTPYCSGSLARDTYDPLVVATKDLTGLVWQVDDDAVIKGRVLTKSGAPVAGAQLTAMLVGGAAREKDDWNSQATGYDGTFELRGLKTGTYRVEVDSDAGIGPEDGTKIATKAGTTTTQDLILDDGGTLTGSVVDAEGKPVADVTINTRKLDGGPAFWSWMSAPHKSDAAGNFRIEALRPGAYRVTAARGYFDELRKPGSNDDAKQGETTTIAAGATATVKLVVESQAGTIAGVVIDADGAPVSDAFISHARESDAAGAGESHAHGTRGWGWGDEKPVLTGTDGSFAIRQLAPGAYTLRAYRKGGGEALAEHVTVGTKTAKLQIKPTASIEGTAKVTSGELPDELEVSVQDLKTGYERSEKFYRTEGRFAVADLPAGHFHLNVSGTGAQAKRELDLATGEKKTGVDVTLDALVTLTGRVVDYVTKAPVPGMRVFAELAVGGNFSFTYSEDMDNTSDETGRFTVKKVPRGKLSVQGMAKDWKEADYPWFRVLRDVTASSQTTIDIGDIGVIKRRVKQGQPAGELGIHFKEQPPETPPDQAELRVSFIEPAGPAAKTELKVGDVIVSVDGIDVTGANYMHAWSLLQAPPGTKVTLGLARGTAITLTLAPPS